MTRPPSSSRTKARTGTAGAMDAAAVAARPGSPDAAVGVDRAGERRRTSSRPGRPAARGRPAGSCSGRSPSPGSRPGTARAQATRCRRVPAGGRARPEAAADRLLGAASRASAALRAWLAARAASRAPASSVPFDLRDPAVGVDQREQEQQQRHDEDQLDRDRAAVALRRGGSRPLVALEALDLAEGPLAHVRSRPGTSEITSPRTVTETVPGRRVVVGGRGGEQRLAADGRGVRLAAVSTSAGRRPTTSGLGQAQPRDALARGLLGDGPAVEVQAGLDREEDQHQQAGGDERQLDRARPPSPRSRVPGGTDPSGAHAAEPTGWLAHWSSCWLLLSTML